MKTERRPRDDRGVLPLVNDMTISNPARPADPRRNPSYPVRTHTHERPEWQALLANWTAKVAASASRLNVLGDHPRRADFQFLHSQMQGALDQIADAARRLPGEVGEMYQEDKHRVDQAVAALERLLTKWETLG
jgi:hypothetical protein